MSATLTKKRRKKLYSTKNRAKRTQVHKMTQQKRWEEINSFIRICFIKMREDGIEDLKEVSNITQLSVPTLRKFASGNFTLHSKIQTLQAISIAAGLKLQEKEYGFKVIVTK